ncbi:MAG: peptidase [Gemmatimonadota bacterium]
MHALRHGALRLAGAIGLVAALARCSSGTDRTDEARADAAGIVNSVAAGGVPGLSDRLKQFAPVTLTFDSTLLDARQKGVVRRLIEAADYLDRVFLEQVWTQNPQIRAALAGSRDDPGVSEALQYFDIMYGPWDRLEEDAPFLRVPPKPAGAGYYPENLTREEFEAWLEAHPEDRDAFVSYYTVIRRDGDALRAIPYSEAYREYLEPAAVLLREAAALADNASLKRFLELRAESLLSDDYFDSEVAWMRLADNLIDPTIGPYEVYEDNLFGYKAAFEAFISLRDPAASAKLQELVGYLPDLERALPIPDEHKYLDRAFSSPITVVDEIYAAGDTRSGIQTIAYNLPNDPRVREREGSKKVMLRNVIRAKFEKILKPIAATTLAREQAARIAFQPYFTRVLMHELAHGLGPDYVTGQPELTVNKGLRERYSAIEEAKADAAGTHSLRVLTERGVYDREFQEEVYIDHVADMFRCVRFGFTEAHGLGCLTQFNFLRESGAITYDAGTGRFAANLERMPSAMADLAGRYLMLEATGDYEGAGAFMERYGSMSPEMAAALERLSVVPVDIRPRYAVRRMIGGW